jgi:hypothetical protein
METKKAAAAPAAPITLKALLKVDLDFFDDYDIGCHMPSLALYNRIMSLSIADLKEEAAINHGEIVLNDDGEEISVFHHVASSHFPLDALVRLSNALGINAVNKQGNTPIMATNHWWESEIFEELADMKADLSIVNKEGKNIYGTNYGSSDVPTLLKKDLSQY